MIPAFSARAHFGKEALDPAYITCAAQQAGGSGTLSAAGSVQGDGFPTLKSVREIPDLKFEISRPRLSKKKGAR